LPEHSNWDPPKGLATIQSAFLGVVPTHTEPSMSAQKVLIENVHFAKQGTGQGKKQRNTAL